MQDQCICVLWSGGERPFTQQKGIEERRLGGERPFTQQKGIEERKLGGERDFIQQKGRRVDQAESAPLLTRRGGE